MQQDPHTHTHTHCTKLCLIITLPSQNYTGSFHMQCDNFLNKYHTYKIGRIHWAGNQPIIWHLHYFTMQMTGTVNIWNVSWYAAHSACHVTLALNKLTATAPTCATQKNCPHHQSVCLWLEQELCLARKVWAGSRPLHHAARSSITPNSRQWIVVSSQRMRWLQRQVYCLARRNNLMG
jgi:hypothetical protein